MKPILFTILAATLILAAFSEEKKYKVELSQNEWEARYSWLETTKAFLKKSDLPSKDVVFVCDSLIGKFQNDLAIQLRPQFLAAADTTKKKSK